MIETIRRTLFRSAASLLVAASVAPAAFAQDSTPASVEDAVKEPGIYAVFKTSMGDVVCKLHHDKTPVTVANFIGLATGEKEWRDPTSGEMASTPFYDGRKFHRVIKNFMIQGGCPLGNGRGGPGYSFSDEFHPDLKHDKPGILSMANSGPATNGSQFFITHVPTPWLDNKHSIFGETIVGQDIVNAMAEVDMKGAQGSTPVEDIVLESVEIVRTGDAAEKFDWAAEFAKEAELVERMKREKEEKEKMQRQTIAEMLSINLDDMQTGEEGLEYVVTQEGTGDTPTKGQTIEAHYTGYLLDGTKFDSSVDRGTPFSTPIGVSRVIKGWDIAFTDMKVGEKRVLFIPADIGYGARGAGNVIPPNATLVFDVELLGVK